MKKTILIVASVLSTMSSFAQNTKVDSLNGLKAQAKSFTAELNVNPLKGQVNFNNSLNQIKFRYFASPSVALRLGFNVSRVDSVNNVNNPYGVNSYFNNNERKSSTVGANLGFEKHLKGTRRLSPYVGIDLSFTDKSSSQVVSDNQTTTTVNNAWTYSYVNNNTVVTATQENGYTRYGLNLFTGFDFYIAQHFYFGYEFNYNVSKTNWKNITISTVSTTNSTPATPNNTSSENSKLTFGPSLINGIRLGYSF